jgi:hypothetical protein
MEPRMYFDSDSDDRAHPRNTNLGQQLLREYFWAHRGDQPNMSLPDVANACATDNGMVNAWCAGAPPDAGSILILSASPTLIPTDAWTQAPTVTRP